MLTIWALYLRERFPLWQFLPLSFIFAAGLMATTYSDTSQWSIGPLLGATLALLLFLFRLRLFDEIKDYQHDRKHYVNRPVARGLIDVTQIRRAAVCCMLIEVILAALFSQRAFFWFVLATVYSLLMYKEFFLPVWLRKHFTLYIISHELLVIPLFSYIQLVTHSALLISLSTLHGALLFGLQFFALEVARKIRPAEDEIASRDTYSAQYGTRGASLLLGSLLIIVLFLFSNLPAPITTIVSCCVTGLTMMTLVLFDKNKTKTRSKLIFSATALGILLQTSIFSLERML